MGIVDIFSKREKRSSGGKGDVFVFDNIPGELRVQIVCIIRDVIGLPNSTLGDESYRFIHDTLAREYGMHQLTPDRHELPGDRLFRFIETAEVARVLDAIEFSLAVGLAAERDYPRNLIFSPKMYVRDAIEELNKRFLEAGVGYQYERAHMIRVDSRFAHTEIVKPALSILSDPRYKGASEEFLQAHKDYRDGNYKGCLTECLKSFESTTKTICEIRKWPYKKTDAARTLIDICLKNNLIPPMLQSELNALQTLLESGVPTLRNKLSAHGQGPVPTVVPQPVAAYALHMTAANIVLLAEAERSLP